MHERRAKRSYYVEDYVFGAAILGALGRSEEA
jgi:hypothetical protein